LVEAMIAVGLLFIIAAGILPLFSRAISNNFMGADATRLSNFARETAEDVLSAPFDQPGLTVLAGTPALVINEAWVTDSRTTDTDERSSFEGRWYVLDDPDNPTTLPANSLLQAQFRRTTTVRQFGIGQWAPQAAFVSADAYAGGVAPEFIQLKEVEIEVRTASGIAAADGSVVSNMMGVQRPTRVRVIKAF
jgi:hypothetical protein